MTDLGSLLHVDLVVCREDGEAWIVVSRVVFGSVGAGRRTEGELLHEGGEEDEDAVAGEDLAGAAAPPRTELQCSASRETRRGVNPRQSPNVSAKEPTGVPQQTETRTELCWGGLLGAGCPGRPGTAAVGTPRGAKSSARRGACSTRCTKPVVPQTCQKCEKFGGFTLGKGRWKCKFGKTFVMKWWHCKLTRISILNVQTPISDPHTTLTSAPLGTL